MMEVDINVVIDKAKKTVSQLTYTNWILQAQVDTLKYENEQLKLENELLKKEEKELVE